MISINEVRTFCLSLPEAEEQPHFEKASFRVKKKIFATLNEQAKTLVVKLSEAEQYAFSAFDNTIIYAIPGAWGKQGWTMIELKRVPKATFRDAVITSYKNVAPKKLGETL